MNTFSKPIILRNLIPEDLRRYLTMVSHIYLRSNNIEFENMDGAHSCSHHNPWTDGLSVAILQRLREETKKNLEPTYGFLRVYNKSDEDLFDKIHDVKKKLAEIENQL